MRRRSSRPPDVLRPEELEGFYAGVQRRLRDSPSTIAERWKSELTAARAALDDGRLSEVDQRLRTIDEALDELVEEPELAEFPRGLVDYVPVGGRGAPTPLDDQQLWNRIRLLGRLLAIRRSQGRSVEALVARLQAAETAYSSGDRVSARKIADEVHTELERDDDQPAPPES